MGFSAQGPKPMLVQRSVRDGPKARPTAVRTYTANPANPVFKKPVRLAARQPLEQHLAKLCNVRPSMGDVIQSWAKFGQTLANVWQTSTNISRCSQTLATSRSIVTNHWPTFVEVCESLVDKGQNQPKSTNLSPNSANIRLTSANCCRNWAESRLLEKLVGPATAAKRQFCDHGICLNRRRCAITSEHALGSALFYLNVAQFA